MPPVPEKPDVKRVAIIGSAGRGREGLILKRGHWLAMIWDVQERLRQLGNPEELCLISGGAAWGDHLAVMMRLAGGAEDMVLYAPCAFSMETWRYIDTGTRDWQNNPGGTANHYHYRFSRQIGHYSLLDIRDLFNMPGRSGISGFTYIGGRGFHERNTLIANNCDYLFAYTLAEGDEPKDGGTRDTWSKCPPRVVKTHVCISSLVER